MRRTVWRLLAAASLIATAPAATRPHYGGTLRVQTSARVVPLDLAFDPLVTFNESAQPQSALATAWKHDADFKRWEFQLRPRVKFHDGTPLMAAIVAAALEGLGAMAQGDVVVIRSERPAPNLLQTLSETPISKRTADGGLIGTGPFRAVVETPGRAVFQANEDYWAGRPYLDSVEVETGRSQPDFDLNRMDVVELGAGDLRRALPNGKRIWTSAPVVLIALVFEPSTSERLREAVALSIDRAAIHNVLLQKQGVPTGAILPQWLSGYAFLFPGARDLEKARQLGSGAAPVNIGYDPADATARLVAERIAVNAREAGLVVRPTGGTQAAGRIVRTRVGSPNPWRPLLSLGGESAGALFEAERVMLQDHRIVPLFHLPEIYGIGSRVKNWAPSRWGGWKLDSVWLAP